MNVRQILDEIEMTLQNLTTRSVKPDRARLLRHMSFDLNELTGKQDWSWAQVHLDPIVSTQTGRRNYGLPENFPDNFCRYAGEQGDKWCCKLDDGTSEQLMEYYTPLRYRSQNIRAMANGRPSTYTIESLPSGRREILLSPPPDANGTTGYTIDGLYIPTDWRLREESALPPIPGNSAILKYSVLKRFDNEMEGPYREAMADLMMREAQQRRAIIHPKLGQYGYNDYTGMRSDSGI